MFNRVRPLHQRPLQNATISKVKSDNCKAFQKRTKTIALLIALYMPSSGKCDNENKLKKVFLQMIGLEMVQNALIHLHKKKATGELLRQSQKQPQDQEEIRPAVPAVLSATSRENPNSGNTAHEDRATEEKVSLKGTAPLLLPHPGNLIKIFS
jgi:hypothetical protein